MNIYDIAQLCNVSTATVSRVLNGNPKVKAETRMRVEEAINRFGYIPSSSARRLGSGSTNMVGLVCSNFADMFYAEAVSLIERGLRNFNYDCILCSSTGNFESQLKGVSMLAQQVDALVFVGTIFSQECTEESLSAFSSVPVFVVNGYVPGNNVFRVISDEKTMVKKIVAEMHRQGASRILYVYDQLSYSGRKKLAGYKDGLADAVIPYSSALLCCVKRELDSAQGKIEELISNGIHFDAVIASEDMFAIAAQKAMSGNDLSAPVVSFNNSILSVCASPKLTSIDLMLDTICRTVVQMLHDYLSGRQVSKRVLVEPVIVERETFHMEVRES